MIERAAWAYITGAPPALPLQSMNYNWFYRNGFHLSRRPPTSLDFIILISRSLYRCFSDNFREIFFCYSFEKECVNSQHLPSLTYKFNNIAYNSVFTLDVEPPPYITENLMVSIFILFLKRFLDKVKDNFLLYHFNSTAIPHWNLTCSMIWNGQCQFTYMPFLGFSTSVYPQYKPHTQNRLNKPVK